MITKETNKLNPQDVIVTITDARAFHGGCVDGWRDFLEHHGYVFKEVLKNGLTAQQLIDTGDVMAIDLAHYVLDREEAKFSGE